MGTNLHFEVPVISEDKAMKVHLACVVFRAMTPILISRVI